MFVRFIVNILHDRRAVLLNFHGWIRILDLVRDVIIAWTVRQVTSRTFGQAIAIMNKLRNHKSPTTFELTLTPPPHFSSMTEFRSWKERKMQHTLHTLNKKRGYKRGVAWPKWRSQILFGLVSRLNAVRIKH